MSAARPEGELVKRLATLLPARPVLAAPASATPEMVDRLVLALRRAQIWDVMGESVAELNTMYETVAEWAAAMQLTVTAPGQVMLIHTPAGAARITGRVAAAEISHKHDAFVSDHLPANLASAERHVKLFVIGEPDHHLAWRPPDPDDRLLLPHHAMRPDSVVAALRRAGYAVVSAAFIQQRQRGERWPLEASVMRLADTARIMHPRALARIDAWERRRLHQARIGRLALHRVRRDILAWAKDNQPGE